MGLQFYSESKKWRIFFSSLFLDSHVNKLQQLLATWNEKNGKKRETEEHRRVEEARTTLTKYEEVKN